MATLGRPPHRRHASRTGQIPWPVVRIGAAMVLLAVVIMLARTQLHQVPAGLAWVRGLGWLAPLAYGANYALAVSLLVPGSLLTLTAGALFGLWPGVPIVFCGAVVGSARGRRGRPPSTCSLPSGWSRRPSLRGGCRVSPDAL